MRFYTIDDAGKWKEVGMLFEPDTGMVKLITGGEPLLIRGQPTSSPSPTAPLSPQDVESDSP